MGGGGGTGLSGADGCDTWRVTLHTQDRSHTDWAIVEVSL
jgi:hypothetical protein